MPSVFAFLKECKQACAQKFYARVNKRLDVKPKLNIKKEIKHKISFVRGGIATRTYYIVFMELIQQFSICTLNMSLLVCKRLFCFSNLSPKTGFFVQFLADGVASFFGCNCSLGP